MGKQGTVELHRQLASVVVAHSVSHRHHRGHAALQQRMGGVIVSTVWILIVTLGLSVLLLPRIGLLGAGVAWLVAQASVATLLLGRFAFNR